MANYKNGVYIVTRLMAALGLKDFLAAGFGGNFIAESGCNPGSVNKQEKSGTFAGSSANGAGYGAGLALWSLGWKTRILKLFNRYTPIETWTLDLQIEIVIKGCVTGFINLLRGCSNVAQAVDIVLRGYENGSSGMGTKLRSKESMNAYTWAKTVYLADGTKRTFSGGYEGLLVSRVSYANKILSMMGSLSLADLAALGSMVGSSGSYDFGGGGTFTPQSPENILKLIEQYRNAYPVHSEYDTYSGIGGNIFSNSKDNAFALASLSNNEYANSKDNQDKKGNQKHTRIYSTNDATIILDELKIPLETEKEMTWANKGVDEASVKKWQTEQDEQTKKVKEIKDTSTADTSIGKDTFTENNKQTAGNNKQTTAKSNSSVNSK